MISLNPTSEKIFNLTGSAFELGRAAIVLAIVIAVINTLLVTVSRVHGASMAPTLRDGDYLLVDRLRYQRQSPARGAIVTLRFPGDPGKSYIKRVIGLPGETVAIRHNELFINNQLLDELYFTGPAANGPDKTWQLAAGQYWLLGDNRVVSSDSRIFGPVERRFIIGQVSEVIWPPSAWQTLPAGH